MWSAIHVPTRFCMAHVTQTKPSLPITDLFTVFRTGVDESLFISRLLRTGKGRWNMIYSLSRRTWKVYVCDIQIICSRTMNGSLSYRTLVSRPDFEVPLRLLLSCVRARWQFFWVIVQCTVSDMHSDISPSSRRVLIDLQLQPLCTALYTSPLHCIVDVTVCSR